MIEEERSGFSVPKGKKVCSVCGEVKRLSHFKEDSDRCIDCSEKMLKTPVKWFCIPIAVVFAVAAVIAVYFTAVTVPFIRSVESAEKIVSSACLYDAFDFYENKIITQAEEINESLQKKFTFLGDKKLFVPGTKTFERYCEIRALADSEYEAGALAESLFDKDYISKNKVISGYVSVADAYDKVYRKVQTINEKYSFTSVNDMKYDEIIAEFEKEEQNSTSDYEKGYFEYFKAALAQFYFDGKNELLPEIKKYLDEMLKFLPSEYTVYGSTLVGAALESEDYDCAIETANFVLEKNKNFTAAYEWLTEAYYKKGDTRKVFETIDTLNSFAPDSPVYYKLLIKYNLLEGNMEAAEKASFDGDSANSEVADAVFNMYLANNRSQITRMAEQIFAENIDFTVYQCALLLLQGDETTAFEVSYNYAYYYAYYYAYLTGDTSLLTQSVINMTTLCAELCRDEAAVEDISQYGMCDETTQKVIDGELSFEDVFVNGKAEIL